MSGAPRRQARRAAPLRPEELAAAARRVDEQLKVARENVARLEDREAEFRELDALLADLPGKVSHPVMVPFGPLAFFPGRIEHTNEVLAQLSSEYFALRTVGNARGMVERRVRRLQRERADVEKGIRELSMARGVAAAEGSADLDDSNFVDIREPCAHAAPPRADVGGATVTRDADGYFDIREPLDEAAEAAPVAGAAPPPPAEEGDGRTQRSVLARLRELERLEEIEELDALLERTESGAGDEEEEDDEDEAAAADEAPAPRSPADLFAQMSRREAEAAAEPAFRPAPRPVAERAPEAPAAALGPSGFGGAVRERGDVAAAVQELPKRASKFKAEWQAVATEAPPAAPSAALGPSGYGGAVREHSDVAAPAAEEPPRRVSKFKAERQNRG